MVYSQRANPGDALLTFVNQLDYFYQCFCTKVHIYVLLYVTQVHKALIKAILSFALLEIREWSNLTLPGPAFFWVSHGPGGGRFGPHPVSQSRGF